MPNLYPIVQAEFCNWDDVSGVQHILGGSFEKLTLRLFDQHGDISPWIIKSGATAQATAGLWHFVTSYSKEERRTPPIASEVFTCLDALQREKRRFHEEAVSRIHAMLGHAIAKGYAVAMENGDRTFRTAKASEIFTALRVVKRAKAVNLFLFPANNLLATEHASSIGSMS